MTASSLDRRTSQPEAVGSSPPEGAAPGGRSLWLAVALVAGLGVALTGYLSGTYLAGGELVCVGGGGCQEVQSSRYAYILGVPIAFLGLGYYGVCLALALGGVARTPGWSRWAVPLLFVVTLAAALFSGYLTGLQLFVIGSFCAWCLGSAALSVTLLGLSLLLLRRW